MRPIGALAEGSQACDVRRQMIGRITVWRNSRLRTYRWGGASSYQTRHRREYDITPAEVDQIGSFHRLFLRNRPDKAQSLQVRQTLSDKPVGLSRGRLSHTRAAAAARAKRAE